jgi:hypothetical protein
MSSENKTGRLTKPRNSAFKCIFGTNEEEDQCDQVSNVKTIFFITDGGGGNNIILA